MRARLILPDLAVRVHHRNRAALIPAIDFASPVLKT